MLKAGLFLALSATFIALVELGSKSALIGLLLGLAFIFVVDTFAMPQKRGSLRMVGRTFAMVSLTALLLMAMNSASVLERLGVYGQIFTAPTQNPTMEVRLLLWDASREIIFSEGHPVIGLGPGAFWVYGLDWLPYDMFISAESSGIEMTGTSLLLQTHNLYLDILLHYGVVGILLFAGFVTGILCQLWRRFRSSASVGDKYLFLCLIAGILAFLSHAFLDFSLYNIGRFWIFMGLASAAISVGKRTQIFN